jgi:hypothetical protein
MGKVGNFNSQKCFDADSESIAKAKLRSRLGVSVHVASIGELSDSN